CVRCEAFGFRQAAVLLRLRSRVRERGHHDERACVEGRSGGYGRRAQVCFRRRNHGAFCNEGGPATLIANSSGVTVTQQLDALSAFHGVDVPFAGNAFQSLATTIVEAQTRTGHQVLDGIRYEHLTGAGQRSNARTNVNGYTADILAHHLAFASMETGTDFNS